MFALTPGLSKRHDKSGAPGVLRADGVFDLVYPPFTLFSCYSACLPTRECGFMVYMNRTSHDMLVVRRSLCALCVAWLLLHGDQASLKARYSFGCCLVLAWYAFGGYM